MTGSIPLSVRSTGETQTYLSPVRLWRFLNSFTYDVNISSTKALSADGRRTRIERGWHTLVTWSIRGFCRWSLEEPGSCEALHSGSTHQASFLRICITRLSKKRRASYRSMSVYQSELRFPFLFLSRGSATGCQFSELQRHNLQGIGWIGAQSRRALTVEGQRLLDVTKDIQTCTHNPDYYIDRLSGCQDSFDSGRRHQ